MEDSFSFVTKSKTRAGDIPSIKVRKLGLLQTVKSFEHASMCKIRDCPIKDCDDMKYTLIHYQICNKEMRQECQPCQQFLALLKWHAKRNKDCESKLCSIPFCAHMKHILKLRSRRCEEMAVDWEPQPMPDLVPTQQSESGPTIQQNDSPLAEIPLRSSQNDYVSTEIRKMTIRKVIETAGPVRVVEEWATTNQNVHALINHICSTEFRHLHEANSRTEYLQAMAKYANEYRQVFQQRRRELGDQTADLLNTNYFEIPEHSPNLMMNSRGELMRAGTSGLNYQSVQTVEVPYAASEGTVQEHDTKRFEASIPTSTVNTSSARSTVSVGSNSRTEYFPPLVNNTNQNSGGFQESRPTASRQDIPLAQTPSALGQRDYVSTEIRKMMIRKVIAAAGPARVLEELAATNPDVQVLVNHIYATEVRYLSQTNSRTEYLQAMAKYANEYRQVFQQRRLEVNGTGTGFLDTNYFQIPEHSPNMMMNAQGDLIQAGTSGLNNRTTQTMEDPRLRHGYGYVSGESYDLKQIEHWTDTRTEIQARFPSAQRTEITISIGTTRGNGAQYFQPMGNPGDQYSGMSQGTTPLTNSDNTNYLQDPNPYWNQMTDQQYNPTVPSTSGFNYPSTQTRVNVVLNSYHPYVSEDTETEHEDDGVLYL